jgi:hypothetical protein
LHQIGLSLGESGSDLEEGRPRLPDLLIKVRRFDLGQELAHPYPISYIDVSAPQVAVRPSIDGRIREGLNVAR